MIRLSSAFLLLGLLSAAIVQGRNYFLRSLQNNLYLTPRQVLATISAVTQTVQAKDDLFQKFIFELKPGTIDRYYIHNAFVYNNVFDITGNNLGNGGVLQIYPKHGGDNQLFQAILNSDGSYTFKAISSGRVIDVSAYSTDVGAVIQQWDSTGNLNQKFYLDSA